MDSTRSKGTLREAPGLRVVLDQLDAAAEHLAREALACELEQRP
jgi:hypothetical protein